MHDGIDVSALAAWMGLEIPPEYHAGVAAQLLALMAQAQMVMSLPLPDELEPATVFVP